MSAADAEPATSGSMNARSMSTSSFTNAVPPTFIVTEVPDVPPEDDTYALAGQTEYTQTEEQRLETRHVEEYLRRMSEKHRTQKRARHDQPQAASTSGSTGLVRRISTSLSRVPSLRHQRRAPSEQPYENTTTGSAYEMTPSHYGAQPAPLHEVPHSTIQGYEPIAGDADESQSPSVHIPEASYSRQELHDQTPLNRAPTGDMSTISLEDLHEPREALDAPESAVISSPTDMSGASAAQRRLHARNFPTVTAGKASSKQMQRTLTQRQRAKAGGSWAPTIPEGDAHADVGIPRDLNSEALGASTNVKKDDPFETPPFSASLGRSSSTDLQELPLQSQSYPSAVLMTTDSAATPSRDLGTSERKNRWYWSDLLLGCGLCDTTNEEDEQAARTNPME